MNFNALLETKETGKHKLGAIANGVNGAVLDNNALVARQQALQGRNDLAQVGLVAVVVVKPLGVKNVVQRDQAFCLVHGSTPDTSKFLHVRTDTKQETEVHAESTDVGSSFAAYPEHTKLSLIVKLVKLALVDRSDTQLSLDSRDERRSLEESTSKGFQRTRELSLASRELLVKADDAHVLLSSTLLRLHKTSGAVNADNETSSDLGVEGTAVASLLNSVGALVQVALIECDCHAYRSMRLIQDTTSWLDGFEGLSRLMTPELMYDLMSRARGAHPWGMGV